MTLISAEKGKLVIDRSRFSRDELVEVYRSMMEAAHIEPDQQRLRYVRNTVFDEMVQDGVSSYRPLPGIRFSVKRFGGQTTFEMSGEYMPNLDPVAKRLREYFG
jgi:hypothetical protein